MALFGCLDQARRALAVRQDVLKPKAIKGYFQSALSKKSAQPTIENSPPIYRWN
jgi:hypothetical protein